ncbi:class I SAM-dependent methyltransferase [Streptomyces sp. NBC_00582]|uniref:class I SAM-dependent methyltransferase n=1 Tax=Streptomyces sp. NBC_00582 TaxID=2975783 RepID=UPI002E7FD19F|nr:class I SAM-dependent methyltransferase [Streptomyces sp. NBC_00582]WUB68408.1 class I SAM-dependent methyltransferase [Streptomyces sp. NBC_00582]
MEYDALTGWDDDITAEAYAAFTRAYPMYSASSRDLAARAGLTRSRVIVDLCGGTGTTAEAILALAPPNSTVVSFDSSAAMQSIGRRLLSDPRLTWVNAPAEDLADHIPASSVDAVACNSAVWKTDVAAVVTAVRRVLRPGGRFVFNIGGAFAGVTHPDALPPPAGPSLSALIEQIATRDYGIIPPTAAAPPKLTLPVITGLLADAGLHVVAAEVTGQHTTTAERAAWLSIPVFAHPEGALTYEQKMAILAEATAQTKPDDVTVTSWLVIVAKLPEEA